MIITNGDKIILKYNIQGKSEIEHIRSYLVISKDDYDSLKKLSKEEKLTINQLLSLDTDERYMIEGSPLYTAVKKSQLNTWIAVTVFIKDKDIPHQTYYYVKNIIRKVPLVYERLMKRIDDQWVLHVSKDDDKVKESISSLDEQMLLSTAQRIAQNQYMLAVTLLHLIKPNWSWTRCLNVITGIKKKNLVKAYGYMTVIR